MEIFLTFIMKTKSMGFGEAVKSLAVEAGMQPFRFTPQDKEKELRFKNYKKFIKNIQIFSLNSCLMKKTCIRIFREKRC